MPNPPPPSAKGVVLAATPIPCLGELTSAVRRLLPSPLDAVDLLAAYGDSVVPHASRPYLRVNMISSLDGAITVDGRSGALGGRGDRRLFFVLRSLADVVLVGAGTVRAERYGPVKLDAELREGRQRRGQTVTPPIAVVTRSCQLDWTSPLFTQGDVRPIVITVADAGDGAARAEEVAEVIVAGEHDVDVTQMSAALGQRGASSVLCEGGPRLNAQLAAAGLIDELCLTLSPRIVQGDGPRIMDGPALTGAEEWRPLHVLEEDGFFFFRLRRETPV